MNPESPIWLGGINHSLSLSLYLSKECNFFGEEVCWGTAIEVKIGQETKCPNDKMSHCIIPGDIMSQLMYPPRWHFVPLSQYESPYLGQNLRVSQVYLGYILDNFWAYLWHIYKKPLFNWHFSGDKLSHQTKCPTFSPATKCPNLCTDAQKSCWKIVGTFCRLSHFVNLKANTLDKYCDFREHSGYNPATFPKYHFFRDIS